MRLVALAAMVCLPCVPAGAVVDDNAARLVTDLVTTALGTQPRLEVISSADVRRQLELEANKQALGCETGADSCLAEIAGAMGAQLVVYGSLGSLGDVVVLTLILFDSKEGRAVGRIAIREKGLSELSGRVDSAVDGLIAPYITKLPVAARPKLLVLDIEPPRSSEAGPQPPVATEEPAASTLFWAGASSIAGGVVAVVAGGALLLVAGGADQEADKLDVEVGRAGPLYDQRDAFGGVGFGGLGIGAALALTGAVLVGIASAE